VFVAGGWQHRTRPRFAAAIRAAATTNDGQLTLPRGENFVVAAIAYLEPATGAELTGETRAGRRARRFPLSKSAPLWYKEP